MTWTGWPAACCPPATGLSWRRRCAGRWRCCCLRGETGGGGREAHGIPGRGEEDDYRGRKVQGGVDEAQRGREEEEGGSGGGWARDGVPGAGGELGRGGRRWPGRGLDDWMTARRMPPCRVSERGVSPPNTCRSSRPVDGARWLGRWGLEVEE
jgi:hypothetical protein